MRSIREDLQKASTTEQTSLSYFGARYYDASLSIWLSVDPLSEARPYLSPYNYCQLNPVMLVDPTGMLDDQPGDLVGEATSKDGGSVNFFNRLLSQMPTPAPEGLPATMRPSSAEYDQNPMIAGNGGGDPKKKDSKPFLINNSDHIILFKPEETMEVDGKVYNNGESYPLRPGESWYHPVDGIAVPHLRKNEIFKMVNGTKAVISNRGVSTTSNIWYSELGQYFRGGWKGSFWIAELNSNTVSGYLGADPPLLLKAPDSSWNSHFNRTR